MELDTPDCNLPWWDAGEGKAYKQGRDKPEQAIAIIPGPNKMALAVFANCAPQEVPGLTNAAWEKLQSKDAAEPPVKKAKKAAASEKPKMVAEVMKKPAAKGDPLDALRATTAEILRHLGYSDHKGVHFYEKGKRFQLDYKTRDKYAQECAKAPGKRDREAEASTHKKFH